MSEPTQLHCYQYVNRPYEAVRALLRERGDALFRRATTSAARRAEALSSTLRLDVGAVAIGVEVHVQIKDVREEVGAAARSPVTLVRLEWQATRAPAVFPRMEAELAAWPLGAGETQLEVAGSYTPPLGVVGTVFDAVLGHRIAEAVVLRFLEDVVEQARAEIKAT